MESPADGGDTSYPLSPLQSSFDNPAANTGVAAEGNRMTVPTGQNPATHIYQVSP
jgi:hypothetical protein